MSERVNANREAEKSIQEIIKSATQNNISLVDSNKDVSPESLILSLSSDLTKMKKLIGFKTGTFLDTLFVNEDFKTLDGIPSVIQLGVVGLSGTGKSLLAHESALRVANQGISTALITSEDVHVSDNDRKDLQSRLYDKASKMGLDWNVIVKNLHVLDAITYSELRNWESFILVYNKLIEIKNVKFVVIDSITMLETHRFALKNRVAQLAQFNQVNGITALYICQRAMEETDKFAIAGNIGVAHNLDGVICIDFAKAMGEMKDQLKVKQWEMVHFSRVLSCRLSGFDRTYRRMEITQDGLLKVVAE